MPVVDFGSLPLASVTTYVCGQAGHRSTRCLLLEEAAAGVPTGGGQLVVHRCEFCPDLAEAPCCSAHGKMLCHSCYRLTHFVEVCRCSRACCVTRPGPSTTLLTVGEREAIDLAGRLWGALTRVVGSGRTRDADLHELVVHVHAIQQAVMSQAAGRAFPGEYRLLGEVVSS